MTENAITMHIKDFSRATGISTAQIYRLLDRGMLQSAKIDDMRLIIMSSYHELIERNRVPPKLSAAAD